MDLKKILFHVLIRIAILILLLIGIFIYRKIDFFESAFFLIQAYCLFLLLEMIYYFVKKNKNLALINLIFLIVIEIIPVLVLIQLTV